MHKKAILTILDGYGISDNDYFNAVKSAKTPNLDKLFKEYPHAELICSGREVGLPVGTMGNSEVGHLNIGAGRVVFQDISKIDKAIEDGEFFENSVLYDTINYCKENGKKLHLMGLVSDGGVHSSFEHIKALVDKCASEGFDNLFIHAFTDGRDTPPQSGAGYLKQLDEYLNSKVGKIASVSGRFYAMDRDKRWERVKKAYDMLVNGIGNSGDDAVSIIKASYDKNVNDEFIIPSNVLENGKPVALIEEKDAVIFFNFRADRARELSLALNDSEFEGFDNKNLNLKYATMTSYRDDFTYPVLFTKDKHKDILGQVIADKGLKQLRIAETEKYAHVTFFFNGGEDVVFKNEERILIPSPKVETYDLQPEMSAYEVCENVVKTLNEGEIDLIILNFANCDMVGHTGIFDAAVKAVETVDECVGKIVEALKVHDYTMLLTADHGNAETMRDGEIPFTAHTKNKVPFLITDKKYKVDSGILADIAPTILDVMGLEIPCEMTGKSLIEE